MEPHSNKPSPIAQQVANIPRSGIRDFFELVQGVPDIISLGVGEPDFVTPWRIREAAIYSLEKGRTSYTSNLGLIKLRQSISRYVREHFHISYDPNDEVLVTVGVSEALDIALRALIDPGDEIIYHEPCYVSYAPSIVMAHGVPVPVKCRAENAFALDPDALEAAITSKTKAIVLNFPTNPTGGTLSADQVKRIAEIAVKHDLVVISDEIYSELTFEGGHVSVASMPGMQERTIFLHGFSKAFAMTGFRIGYACAPKHLLDAMLRIHQYCMLCAGITSQEAAIEALDHGFDEAMAMRDQYLARRNFIVQSFNEMGLNCHLPRGSFYAFPSIQSTGVSSKEFATQLLKETKVACIPGTAFGASGEGFLRCCFATSLSQIEVAMERMAEFVRKG
jgi:aminotransferase